MNVNTYNIPAGYAWHAFVKIGRAVPGSTDYEDITDPADVPSDNWVLCFVGPDMIPAVTIPVDWSKMTAEGFVAIELTAEQTLELAGQRLHLEVRNSDGTSDLMTLPDDTFYFVPNDLYNK